MYGCAIVTTVAGLENLLQSGISTIAQDFCLTCTHYLLAFNKLLILWASCVQERIENKLPRMSKTQKEAKMCKNPTNSKDSLPNINPEDERTDSVAPPSFLAKYSCLAVFIALFGVWAKFTFLPEDVATPTVHLALHGYQVPLLFTLGYLFSLPILKYVVETYCTGRVEMKELLFPSMVFYNVAQVIINCWMVYRFINAVLFEGHPFIGDMASTKCAYIVWVHYTNKYLEFLDTYFMVLRGKIDQVRSFTQQMIGIFF